MLPTVSTEVTMRRAIQFLAVCGALGMIGTGCASDPPPEGRNSNAGTGAKPASGGTGVSGTGVSGTGVSGTGVSGIGASGTGISGTGVSGTGVSGTGAGGTGVSGTAAGGTGVAGMSGEMVNCSALPAPTNPDDLISAFEDGLGNVTQGAGRGGGFYMFNDMTAGAMQMPPPGMLPPARMVSRCPGSSYALCMSGSGFMTWGAGMGTDLAPTSGGMGMGMKQTYDASMYKGIQFWAKSVGSAGLAVRVSLKDKNTAPEGGVCDKAMSSGPEACNDDWGKNLNLTNTWQPYTILYSEMKQAAWGKVFPMFDSKAVYALQFQVNKGITFDMCIDDVAFVR